MSGYIRELLGGEGKIGYIPFDVPFFVAQQREEAYLEVIEETDGLEITVENGFTNVDDVYSITQNMLTANPNLDGLFISWDVPSLQAA